MEVDLRTNGTLVAAGHVNNDFPLSKYCERVGAGAAVAVQALGAP